MGWQISTISGGLTAILLLAAFESTLGQTSFTNRAAGTISLPDANTPASSPCLNGAEALSGRQFENAQQLLWLCVLSNERQPQDAVNLTFTYRALRNYTEGQTRVAAEIERAPANEDLHYVSAYLLFRTRQYEASMKELTAAYVMKQDDWRLHQLFALCFVEQKNNSYSEQEFARAIKLNPENAELYYQLSRLYYTEQRFSEALDASSRAVAISPNYAEAYDNMGLCYKANGDIPQAIESFSRAINLTERAGNKDPWPYINFAVLLEAQSPGSAISLLEQAVSIDPQNADANYYLGRSLLQNGQAENAQKYFEKTIAIDPACASAYYALATLLRARDPGRSATLLRKFEELRSQHPDDHAGPTRACSE